MLLDCGLGGLGLTFVFAFCDYGFALFRFDDFLFLTCLPCCGVVWLLGLVCCFLGLIEVCYDDCALLLFYYSFGGFYLLLLCILCFG